MPIGAIDSNPFKNPTRERDALLDPSLTRRVTKTTG
jgi:hypothetical protein